MSTYYFFPEDVLRNLSSSDLRKLADYYGIKYQKNTAPKTIINKVLNIQKSLEVQQYTSVYQPEGVSDNVSVRVKRIREQNKEI